MISTIKSYKMLSLSPPCKSSKCMSLRLWLVVVMVLAIIACTSAGVIKKREITFTIENVTMTTTMTTEATTTIASKHDPDIAQSDLSHISLKPVTITTTNIAAVDVETSTSEPVTKLVLQSNELKSSSNSHTDNLGSSREYVLNEIALNETKKEARLVDNNQKETEIDLKKTTQEITNRTLNANHVETTNSNENVETTNYMGNHIESRTNDTKSPLKKNDLEEVINNAMLKDVTTEKVLNFEDQTQSTTSSTIKDNTIETNHILHVIKHPENTTENLNVMQDLQHSVSLNNVQLSAISHNVTENEQVHGNPESTTLAALRIHDGLDRESLGEISNDLPDKTTESTFKTETVLDTNKVEHARSMFMSGEDEIATTLLPTGEKEIDTSTSLPNSHLDHLKNSIELEEFTPSPVVSEKKAKFINDNSTNAQKLNLPNNADVWSLAGMKPITYSPNVTMETAPKHKDMTPTAQEEKPDEKETMHKTTESASINNNNSEKFLLDWSQIMLNKELATTANYQEYNENGETENDSNFHTSSTVYNESTTPPPTTASAPGDVFQGPTMFETLTNSSSTHNESPSTITANSTTILSVSSFDNNNENNHKHELLLSSSPASVLNSVTEMLDITTTEIMPTATVATVLETKANPDLNEINLTLNKTTTTDVGETSTQHRDEQHSANDNRHDEGNVNVHINEHNGVTPEPQLTTTTAVVADESMTNNNNMSTTTTTTTTESTTTSNNTTETTATTATATAMSTSTADKTSSEPTITISTHESGKVNASNSSERNTIFDDSEKRQGIKSENNNNKHSSFKWGDKENIEIFATTTTTTDIPITTYKPKFVDLDLNPSGERNKNTTTTSSSSPNKIPIAEVVDQNGNEIEHKKSINVETITTTTATQPISGSFNISSTTIKTHLNEQVFEIATTTTTTPATTTTTTITPYNSLTTESSETKSEQTTSSSAKDEIINGKDLQLKENNIITTPKTPTTTTSYSPNTTEQVEHTAIGSSPPPSLLPQQNKEDGKLEATTTRTDTSETPVDATTQGVPAESSGQTTTLSATATTTTSSEEYEDTTKVDTYFKFPIRNKGTKKEEHTVEPIKDDDKLETTTIMSLQPINNNTQQEDDINISLLNETYTTTTTISTSTTQVPEKIYTTAAAQTTTSTFSPPPPPPLSVTTDSNVPTKIDELYNAVISTTTEIPQFTTEKTVKVTDVDSESPTIYNTPAPTISNNINEDLYTTLSNNNNNFSEEFTTMLPTDVIAAEIGGGAANSLPPLMGGNSGNMFPKNSEASGETDVNVIIAITVSVIGVIALILLVAFLYLMRKRQKGTPNTKFCQPVSLDEYVIDNASVRGSMRKGSALRSSKRTYGNMAFDDPSLRHNTLGVRELAKFSAEKLRIFEEFRDVPLITAREDEVPQGCEDKNRYSNVSPLPETRVVLQRINEDYKTEYINANYVTGPKDTPNYYIACQAPLDTTVEDFWRMIWEQQSRVIIQATDLIENGVEKCAEYLPPSVTLDNHSTFGDFQITLQNREVKDKYAISTLLLKHNGENVTRELTHYWYKWPETGVPAEEAPIIAMLLEARSSLISYAIEQANEDKEKNANATLKSAEEGTVSAVVNGSSSPKSGGGNGEINGNISMVPIKKTARNQGPLTIHCSPGTGRTGTIIACDIAIRSLETPKRTVDIPHIVYYVRRGRASAVLTKEQYEFIYKVANVYAAKISNPTTYN